MTAAGAGIRLSEGQRRDWLALSRSEGVGPLTFRSLINRHGTATSALEALPELARSRGRTIRVTSAAEAEKELAAAERHGARFIAWGEPEYPALLRACDGPPPLIAIRGRAECLSMPAVAIVGSRNASAAGRTFTERLAGDLARNGIVIISGLARGIDTRAHEASIGHATVGVLAGGLDRPYPPENLGLLERIAEQGCVVSEMPFGWEPRGRDFPRRNRIISGLSYGTVVVEAARKSGSLITARFAGEQGRTVFAVPGSPLDPRAEGTNDLLRHGATLCTGADDVLGALAPMLERPDLFADRMSGEEPRAEYRGEPLWDELISDAAEPGAGPSLFEAFEERESPNFAGAGEDAAARVLAALGPAPVEADDLMRHAAVSPRELQTILFDLELLGRIERHGGNRVSLVGTT